MVLAYNTNAGGGLLSGAEKLSSAYLERNRRKGLASGLEQIQGGDWEGGVNTIAQTDPDTALGLAQYKQQSDDRMALQQAKMQQEAELRNTLTPYQQEMLTLKRQQLAQGGSGSNGFGNTQAGLALRIASEPDKYSPEQVSWANNYLMSGDLDYTYNQAYQKKRGSAQADIETRGDIAYQSQAGKDRATLEKENTALERNLPAFEDMTNELIGLADKATYTKAGQARDWLLRQTGQPMSDGGIAREKYRQVVANELIPKLKQMFGGQLSDSERESLLATLGDVNLAPEEKKSAINAFIEAKRRQVKYNQPQNRISQQNNDYSNASDDDILQGLR